MSIEADKGDFPETDVLRLKGTIAAKIQFRRTEDLLQFQNIVDLTTEHDLLDDHMEAAMECTLFQEGAGTHDWRITMLGRGMRQLWDWMHRLALDAKNPNVKSEAGRALGEIYHLAATSKQTEKLRENNEAFLDQVRPFKGRHGGKPIAQDLKKWVHSQMGLLRHTWCQAMRVAYRAASSSDKSGKMLERFWKDYFKTEDSFTRQHNKELASDAKSSGTKPPAEFVRQDVETLRDHAITKLWFDQLSNFKPLWNEVLKKHLKQTWETARKAGNLRVEGDQSFLHRFGDSRHKGPGYNLAEKIFKRDWMPLWKQLLEMHLKAMKGIQESCQEQPPGE